MWWTVKDEVEMEMVDGQDDNNIIVMDENEDEEITNRRSIRRSYSMQEYIDTGASKGSSVTFLKGLFGKYFTVYFLLACMAFNSYLTEVINVVSTISPIVQQPAEIVLGDSIAFGSPIVLESTLTSAGLSSSMYTVVGKEAYSGANLVRFSSINATSLINGGSMTYDDVYQLALTINEGHMNSVGGCVSKGDPSGGLSGGSSLELFQCNPYSSNQKAELNRWIVEEEISCRSTYMSNVDIFHKCLLFSAHNPGSMYIIAGQIGAEGQLDCEYKEMDLKSWDVDFGSWPVEFKKMNNHLLYCDERQVGQPQVQVGFLVKTTKFVEQTWPFYDEHYEFETECYNNYGGSITEYAKWSGDVALGVYEIIVACKDQNIQEASQCFEYVMANMDPSSDSWITWSGFLNTDDVSANAFPAKVIEKMMDHTLTVEEKRDVYSGLWREFSVYKDTWTDTTNVLFTNTDAFRRTFGWGWDIYPRVVGSARWGVTSDALYRTNILPLGTQHTMEMRCLKSDGNTIIQDSGDNWRTAGSLVSTPIHYKMINVAGMVALLLLAYYSGVVTNTRMSHFLLGVLSVVTLASFWVFQVAVNLSVSRACECRVSSLFYSQVATFFNSFVDRWSVASLSASLCQAICWLHNIKYTATGEMPIGPTNAVILIGTFYALLISGLAVTWQDGCASVVDLNSFDIYVPIFIGVCTGIAVPYVLEHEDRFNLSFAFETGWDKQPFRFEYHGESMKERNIMSAVSFSKIMSRTIQMELTGTEEDNNFDEENEWYHQGIYGKIVELLPCFHNIINSVQESNLVIFRRPNTHDHEYGLVIYNVAIKYGKIMLTDSGALGLDDYVESIKWPVDHKNEIIDVGDSFFYKFCYDKISGRGIATTPTTPTFRVRHHLYHNLAVHSIRSSIEVEDNDSEC